MNHLSKIKAKEQKYIDSRLYKVDDIWSSDHKGLMHLLSFSLYKMNFFYKFLISLMHASISRYSGKTFYCKLLEAAFGRCAFSICFRCFNFTINIVKAFAKPINGTVLFVVLHLFFEGYWGINEVLKVCYLDYKFH